MVEEVWGENVAVARQKQREIQIVRLRSFKIIVSVFEAVFARLKTLNDFLQRNRGFYFTLQ